MNAENISGALVYSHDTVAQFEEFKELFIRSNITAGIELESMSIEEYGPIRLFSMKGGERGTTIFIACYSSRVLFY